ncbi:aldehyde dehydrogenase family protein [Aliiglaciecola litoralis]|uniref:Aldehyde dehydrogenase n=1 Tax=Aliiglaciecola litoralis TaxID=582857 RepID=A0ABP3WP30_9ALTE
MSVANNSVSEEKTISAIAQVVSDLKNTFATGVTKSVEWRAEQLTQLKRMTEEQQDKILAALGSDLGKCKAEAWTSEIGYTLSDIDHTLKHLKKWMKPRKVSTPIAAQPGKSYQLAEPLGTALIIGAWNYPFQLVFAPLIAAIAAGNCAVLKPSELAPATSSLIAKMVPEYLDSNAIAVVEGAVDETTELLKQPFDHIFYTGGETVGKIVMRAAAEHLTPVTLELGGKSPCIVENSANIDVTAARIVWSKWMNAGQTCVAPDYVLVEKSLSNKLIAAIQTKVEAFYGTDIANNPDYGRIVNERHFQRLTGYLQGQNVVFGGQQDAQTKFLAPTIVLDPDPQSRLMQEEIFGPILPVITLDSIDQAIPLVNQRAKPLALYAYTNDKTYEQKVLNQTSAGSTCINDGFMFMVNPELPFGGVGNSGMGNYHGKFGFDTFSHLKTVMKRSFKFDVSLRYPPFSNIKSAILKRLL